MTIETEDFDTLSGWQACTFAQTLKQKLHLMLCTDLNKNFIPDSFSTPTILGGKHRQTYKINPTQHNSYQKQNAK